MAHCHLETTAVVAVACSRCREPTFHGVVSGLHVRVDPYPLSREVEIIAVFANRSTYTLTTFANHLVSRSVTATLRGPVLMEHVCYKTLKPPPATADTQRDVFISDPDAEPPF
jgi:hypothetical protein